MYHGFHLNLIFNIVPHTHTHTHTTLGHSRAIQIDILGPVLTYIPMLISILIHTEPGTF